MDLQNGRSEYTVRSTATLAAIPHPYFLFSSAQLLGFQGRFDEALVESDRARQLDPLSLTIATDHGVLLYFSRQYDRAIEQFRSVLYAEPGRQNQNPAAMLSMAYAGMGETDKAVLWLQRAHDEHLPILTHPKVDPVYDSIRHDPKFQQLLRQAGLAPD